MKDLGEAIRTARLRRGWSLAETGDKADLSAAYLHKLEKGRVDRPSPTALRQVAGALDVAYLDLMRLAGYVVRESGKSGSLEALAAAFHSEALEPEEIEALTMYLKFYREQRRRQARRG